MRDQKIETMPRHRVLETMRRKGAGYQATFERDTVKPAVVACQILDGLTAEVTLAAYVDSDGDPVVCVAFNSTEVRLRELEMHDGLAPQHSEPSANVTRRRQRRSGRVHAWPKHSGRSCRTATWEAGGDASLP